MKFVPLFVALTLLPLVAFSAEETIDIRKEGGRSLPPISIAGFTGETKSVLEFDLEIAGFQVVSPENAQYNLSGSNDGGKVEGRLIDRISKAVRMGKSFSGGTARSQAHALADEVVLTLTGQPGIARTRIIFKRDLGRTSEIYVSDYDGANPVALTQDGTVVAAPCWDLQTGMAYYTSYKSGFPDIFSHNLSTGQRGVVAKYSGLNTSPAASPDGKRVAMILSKNGSPDVYVAHFDGTNLKQLTRTKEDESSPCWSPDGRTICFVSRMSGRPALYTIPASGGEPKRLQAVGVGSIYEPDWSPDGKFIIFTVLRGNFELCMIPSTGGEVVNLGVSGEDPSWAPNSRTVVYTRRANNQRTLSLLDVPTKRVKYLKQNLGNCSQPNWAK